MNTIFTLVCWQTSASLIKNTIGNSFPEGVQELISFLNLCSSKLNF